MQVYREYNSSKKAILFFAGWGMDQNPFQHMKHKGYDLLIFYDYSSLRFDGCPPENVCTDECKRLCIMHNIFNSYREVYIVAWGFGVWCASAAFDRYLERLGQWGRFYELMFWAKIKRTIAINGTLMPISKFWGISPRSYKKTISALPDKSVMEKFLHRMCHTKGEYDFYMQHAPKRDAEQAKEELVTIENCLFLSNSLTWDTAIVGDNDVIFKSERQRVFWNNYAEIAPGERIPGTKKTFNLRMVEIEGSHYLFNRFESWDEIIAL